MAKTAGRVSREVAIGGITLLLTVVSVSQGACINNCNGRGDCTDDGLCNCWPGFRNGDCSERDCPYWRSWGMNAADPHWYEECSGRGMCDRTSGECACEPGFSGHACQRRKCHNDCSGHGVCGSGSCLSDVEQNPRAWEKDRISRCVCDPGFFGSDCSKRMCPRGDDPRTHCTSFLNQDGDVIQQHDKNFVSQLLTYHIPMGVIGPSTPNVPLSTSEHPSLSTLLRLSGEPVEYDETLFVRFTDEFSQRWDVPTVKSILSPNDNDFLPNLKNALESLPLFAINGVNVEIVENWLDTYDTTVTTPQTVKVVLRVDYVPDVSNGLLVGNENLLECMAPFACSQPGCKPRVKIPYVVRYSSVPAFDLSLFDNGENRTLAPPQDPVNRNARLNTAWNNKNVILIHPDSDPGLPTGEGWKIAEDEIYDVRIAIMVVDTDGETDSWYVHVGGNNDGELTFGENKVNEMLIPGDKETGPDLPDIGEGATKVPPGYLFMGKISTSENAFERLPVPNLPGVWLRLPSANMVEAGEGKFFEIMYKLPQCSTEHVSQEQEDMESVSSHVENAECSQRGICNHVSGECQCFSGFTGRACGIQDTLG